MDEHTAHTPKDVDKIHLELLSTDDRDTAIRPAHPGEQPFGRLPDGGHTAKQGSDPDPNNVPMCQRYRVTSERFFDWLQQLGQLSNNAGDRKRFYFRGESRANYQLLPSLLRDGIFKSLSASHGARSPIELQQKLLDRYRRYTQHLIHSDNDFQAPISEDFDTLCLAQHHGLPTLLMDWSLNPYVAAYFALSGAFRTAVREELSARPEITKYWARVWVMRLKKPADRKQYTVHLENRKSDWDKQLGDVTLTPSAPLIVVPLVFTRRIAAQAGRFVYCGHIARDMRINDSQLPDTLCKYSAALSRENASGSTPPDLSWDQLYSLDIEFDISKEVDQIKGKMSPEELRQAKLEAFKRTILNTMAHLEFTGFHAGRLFPDLEGWARYLAEGNL